MCHTLALEVQPPPPCVLWPHRPARRCVGGIHKGCVLDTRITRSRSEGGAATQSEVSLGWRGQRQGRGETHTESGGHWDDKRGGTGRVTGYKNGRRGRGGHGVFGGLRTDGFEERNQVREHWLSRSRPDCRGPSVMGRQGQWDSLTGVIKISVVKW